MTQQNKKPDEKPMSEDDKRYGRLYPVTFTTCPHCGCTRRFAEDAMKEDRTPEEIGTKIPCLGSLEYTYHTALYDITLVNIVDSCRKCGAIITVARMKRKRLNIGKPPPGSVQPPFMKG
jgi:RNase P subunit RPR2